MCGSRVSISYGLRWRGRGAEGRIELPQGWGGGHTIGGGAGSLSTREGPTLATRCLAASTRHVLPPSVLLTLERDLTLRVAQRGRVPLPAMGVDRRMVGWFGWVAIVMTVNMHRCDHNGITRDYDASIRVGAGVAAALVLMTSREQQETKPAAITPTTATARRMCITHDDHDDSAARLAGLEAERQPANSCRSLLRNKQAVQ
ncbi:hypothetical protein E2C01_026851 [Portunus trituberculatus]|uniref:Uncharacterized protein n=1 Tax=Portunus trituberculatus TaxID=210409 RepID=A0A5B7EK33_PORTR|nr:hypothetical protein [Portunus trituberculatus]